MSINSNSSFLVGVRMLCRVRPFVTPWTIAHQTPLSMQFPRQEYWSELPFPTPGDLPHPGTKSTSLASSALAGEFLTNCATWEVLSGAQDDISGIIVDSNLILIPNIQSKNKFFKFVY